MAKRNDLQYKQYKRGQRSQFPEENFKLGMNYTNTPLAVGAVKLLVNYDLKDGGESLQPRSGLRVNELGMFTQDSNPPDYDDKLSISVGRECVEDEAESCKQMIVGKAGDTKVEGTNLYEGTAHALTISNDAVDPGYFEDIVTKPMVSSPLHLEDNLVRFRRPDKAQIHNMQLSNLGYIAKHVGSFAFSNSYYYFLGPQQLYKTKFSDGKYISEAVTVKAVTPKEAVLWGYNMLKANPYTFDDTETSGIIQLLGLLPYDENGQVIMSPQINQTVKFRCYYAGPSANKYKVYWDWKEVGGASWTTFNTEEFSLDGFPELSAEFSSPNKDLMIRITAYKWDETETKYSEIAEKVLTVGFSLNKEAYGSTANIEVKSYDLSTATGMSYWKNRLVLYGVPKDPTILWFSDINEPGYFPYPNNIDAFDEPVISVTPILDNLLVFTSTKLHMLTLSADGLTWTKRMIQGNLDINEWDIHLIQIVKNMVFFKSGNYYYMVVPKAMSQTGELAIAPISKNIEGLLDEFLPITKEVVDVIYGYQGSMELIHYYNFLDFEDVHNIYVFKTDLGVYLNIDLLYNTVLRVWRMHTYESQHILQPYKQDATKKGTFVSITQLNQRFGETIKTVAGLQYHQFSNSKVSDLFIPLDFNLIEATEEVPAVMDDLQEEFEAIHEFKNYQLLDGGYREHGSDYNKRYREVQIKFNNISQKNLKFSTEYTLDGDMRKSFYKYETHHEIDPEDPNYGLIYLERIPVIAESIPGSTVFSEDEEDSSSWTLDTSRFPETILWKVRMPISGKGAAPKLRMLSLNEERYELLNVIWVFRMMNSR